MENQVHAHGRPQREQNGHLLPLKIETKHQNVLEKIKLTAQFRSTNSILQCHFICRYDTLHNSQVYCYGVMQ